MSSLLRLCLVPNLTEEREPFPAGSPCYFVAWASAPATYHACVAHEPLCAVTIELLIKEEERSDVPLSPTAPANLSTCHTIIKEERG